MSGDRDGWVKLYHPSGAQCALPLLTDGSQTLDEVPVSLFKQCSAYVAAGFSVNAPGLEAGEQKEEVGWVLRKEHEKDGETTQVVAVYSVNPALTWKVMHKYLNEDADQVEFNRAAGIRLTDLPIYPGGDYPERGKAASTDKFIIKVPRPFFVVWKDNPKHVPPPPEGQKDTRSATQKMTKLFVRWEPPIGGVAQQQSQEKPRSKVDEMVAWWAKYLDKDPSLGELSDNWRRFVKSQTAEVIKAVEDGPIDSWRGTTGCWWDTDKQQWMPPQESAMHDDPMPF